MITEIRHRYTNAVLYSCELSDGTANPVREALLKGIAAGANLARADLADAYLAGANLADANLAGAYLADANLAGADLADANLADANLADANLARADLARAYLADANDLSSGTEAKDPPEPYVRATTPEQRAARDAARAERYRQRHPDVPVVPALDRRILEMIESGKGMLKMTDWHTCETTHCRAGWAIHLAGKAGYKLERKYDPARAGRMIYLASTGQAPHFYATDEAALADIRARAAEQSEPTS